MNKKLILILALCFVIVMAFTGCRKLGSDVNSAVSGAGGVVSSVVSGAGGVVSGAVSKVESEGKELGSAVSGTVSGVTSSLTSR